MLLSDGLYTDYMNHVMWCKDKCYKAGGEVGRPEEMCEDGRKLFAAWQEEEKNG